MLLLLSFALVLSASPAHARAHVHVCAREGNVIADTTHGVEHGTDSTPALTIELATKVSAAQRALGEASRAKGGVPLPSITDVAQFDHYGETLSATSSFVDALTKAGTTPKEFAVGFAVINKALLVASLTDAAAQRGITFDIPEALKHVPMADVQFARTHRDELAKLGFQQQVSAQVQTPVQAPAPTLAPAPAPTQVP